MKLLEEHVCNHVVKVRGARSRPRRLRLGPHGGRCLSRVRRALPCALCRRAVAWQVNRAFYRQRTGIPQGSVLSSLLCRFPSARPLRRLCAWRGLHPSSAPPLHLPHPGTRVQGRSAQARLGPRTIPRSAARAVGRCIGPTASARANAARGIARLREGARAHVHCSDFLCVPAPARARARARRTGRTGRLSVCLYAACTTATWSGAPSSQGWTPAPTAHARMM